MRLGNFIQAAVVLVLFTLTAFEYKRSKEWTEEEIYALRVEKSYSSRTDFTYKYGPDFKNVIKQKLETTKLDLNKHYNTMLYKALFIIVLALVSIFHFIRYFYTDYDLEYEHLPLEKYDALSWFLNFVFCGIAAIWYLYFSNGGAGAVIGYILAILCAVRCLWHISNVIQIKQIRKLKGIRIAEIAVATLIYFHLLGFVFVYYLMMIVGLPAIQELLGNL